MSNPELISIQHNTISDDMLNEVIQIKSVAWDFSVDSQFKWIEDNLKENDLHILLKVEGEFVAYLNLIDISVILDDIPIKGWGVGNVCAKIRGKGYGQLLMRKTNDLILESGRIGLLFCKNELVDFYAGYSWNKPTIGSVIIPSMQERSGTQIMMLNLPSFFTLKYSGKLF